jgi:hypothetical protein
VIEGGTKIGEMRRERARVHEWAAQGGVEKIFYFRRPNYVRRLDRKKPSKVIQFSTARLLSTVLRPNFLRP